MFYNCKNLQYLNIKNFEQNSNLNYNEIFYGIPKNLIVCINKTKAPDLYQLIQNLNCGNIYCSDDWYIKQKKYITEINECIDNCNNNQNYKYEFNNKCYDKCSDKTFNEAFRCNCENENCFSCSDLNPIKHLCISCKASFYPKENDPTNLGPYINCYKDPLGYYLDENDNIYKECHKNCKTCYGKGTEKNNNCKDCNPNYIFINETNQINTCFNCKFYYFFDNLKNEYSCTDSFICPKENNKFINNKNKCLEYCKMDDVP